MRKLIASINMTLDGYCDHTAMMPDDDGMRFFNDLLRNADTLLYGRTTYQLMESYWPPMAKDPSGDELDDEFAVLIDNIQKIVYSRTLKSVTWKNSVLKNGLVREEVLALKERPGKDILAGSPSLIVLLMKLGLVDELQLVVHPVIVGSGLPLFKNIEERMVLKLLDTKAFSGGAVVMTYEPRK